MSIETNSNRFNLSPIKRIGLFVGLGAGTLSLASCTAPNYEGAGNDFRVRATVEETTWQSITANVYRIDIAEGEATDEMWFAATGQTEEFHDNCDCDDSGFFTERITIGELHDGGVKVSPETLAVGTCVEFTGKIRVDNDGKYSHDRPVYELAEVVPCGS